MSSYGFVYLFGNTAMPNTFKVGCTERSPHLRALELSNASGVPEPFCVICYIEVRDCQQVEREMHAFLSAYRVSDRREFFRGAPADLLIGLLAHYPGQLAFTDVDTWFLRPFEVELPPTPYERSPEKLLATLKRVAS